MCTLMKAAFSSDNEVTEVLPQVCGHLNLAASEALSAPALQLSGPLTLKVYNEIYNETYCMDFLACLLQWAGTTEHRQPLPDKVDLLPSTV